MTVMRERMQVDSATSIEAIVISEQDRFGPSQEARAVERPNSLVELRTRFPMFCSAGGRCDAMRPLAASLRKTFGLGPRHLETTARSRSRTRQALSAWHAVYAPTNYVLRAMISNGGAAIVGIAFIARSVQHQGTMITVHAGSTA
jgi:hypothetical protein